MNDWNIVTGYRGLKSHVWRSELQCVVREDVRAIKRRFKVFALNKEVARFETLKEAQTETLRRLIEMAQPD